MRILRALQTSAITIALLTACAALSVAESATASSQCHDKHHHDNDDEVNYKRPHIHAKPDPYVRPYSSSQGIRGDFDTRSHSRYENDDYDPDYDDNRNMYDSDEPEEE